MGSRPWERRNQEPPDAYQAFLIYRDMGSARSAGAVAGQLGKAERLISRWARRWSWEPRAMAWYHQQAAGQGEVPQALHETVAMAERQVKEALLVQEKATRRLMAVNPDELSPVDALRFLTEATRIEREARKILLAGGGIPKSG